MNCQKCNGETRVTDSRPVNHTIRRRRVCMSCGFRVTTWESTINPAVVIKHRASKAAKQRRLYNAKSLEERKALKKREHTRAQARQKAAETGESLAVVYERWGCS